MNVFDALRELISEKRVENSLVFKNEEWNIGLDQALGIISRLERESGGCIMNTCPGEWIRTKDRLPAVSGVYLVTTPGLDKPVSWSYDAEAHEWVAFCDHKIDVIAWMPLPRKYTDKKEKEDA